MEFVGRLVDVGASVTDLARGIRSVASDRPKREAIYLANEASFVVVPLRTIATLITL